MPKDSKGSTGSSYIVDEKNRKVLIPIDVNKIEDIKKVLGTLTEEVAHGKDALEGRQDKKVAEDKSNDEEGLESLGRPANEYVKKRFGEDNNSKIKLTTDGIDLSNADVGEKVGDDIHDDMQYEQSLSVATTLNRGAKVIRPDVQKEIEREGYTKVIEKYGKIPYVDSIHKKYGDEHKEEVKLKQLEAEEKTRNSKTEIFYVRIDGINKEVTIESVPKAQGLLRTVSDTIGGLVKNSEEYQSYDYDTRLSKEEKEIKKAKKKKS